MYVVKEAVNGSTMASGGANSWTPTMGASGRYLAETSGERGQVKVVIHAETQVLLGVHLIGGACSEMIWGAAALIEAEFRVKELEEIVFPHPTVSELIKDAVFTLH